MNHVYHPLAESNGKLLTLLKALKAKGGVQLSRRRAKHMSASSLSALEAKKEFEFIIPPANPPEGTESSPAPFKPSLNERGRQLGRPYNV